jgi:hypothetical protein
MANSIDMKEPSLTDWLTAVGTVGTVIVASVVAIQTYKTTTKIEQSRSLADVFKLLDDNAHRNARRRVLNLYKENDERRRQKILKIMGLKDEDIKRMDAIHHESKEIVKADFNEIGSLLENKIILRDEFLKIYWLDVLKCWKVLYEEDIELIRQQSRYKDYMINFEHLKCYAESYQNPIFTCYFKRRS